MSGLRLSVSGDVVRVSVSPGWLAALPASAFPVVIDPTFNANQTATQLVSVSNTGSVLYGVMQNGYSSSQLWRSAAWIPAPALPAQQPGSPPWQLARASFMASCASSCGQPGVGLTGPDVYGESTPASTYPPFAGIPDGTPIWLNPPSAGSSSISTDMTAFFKGRTGAWIGVTTNEAGLGYGTLIAFDPSQVFASFLYVEQPPATTITAPVYGSVLTSATPTLTAAPVTGETSAYYDFKLSTSSNGTGMVIDSGWLDSNQTSWTVPPGSLQDGVVYWATVLDAISPQWDPSLPSYVPPAYPNPPVSFEIKERLGGGGPSPTDTVGSSPGGTTTPSQGAPSPGASTASETVNMVTGNLAVAVTTPGMQALGGTAGITLAYDSASSSASSGVGYGVTAQYYPDSGSHAFTGSLIGQRAEPGVNETWEVNNPPIGGLGADAPFLVRWTGEVTLPNVPPNSTWVLGGLTTGGMRVYMNGSGTPAYDDWSGTASQAGPSYGTATFSGGHQYQIEVDDWENYQALPQPVVQLWAHNTSITDPSVPSAFVVPSGWLTPVATGVPPGWSMQANPATVQWIHADDQGNEVVLQGPERQTETFTQVDPGLYQAQPGDDDYLNVDGNGHLQLSTSDNYLYTFNPDGSLASMTSVADDRHPAALQYSYSGSPALLRTINDPVSGRSVTISYGGDPACPGGQAPPGMLCQVAYWDGSTATIGYQGNEIASVTGPGGQTSMFGYDSNNQLADIRDALASDYLTSGGQVGAAAGCAAGTTGLSVLPTDTQVCYDSSGRVAAITQPAPASGAARPGRTYTYASGHTDMAIAGFSPAAGYAERDVYDAEGRITQQIDSAGHTTTTVWATPTTPDYNYCNMCAADEPIVTATPDGDQTSTVYDQHGDVTDVYGPAPLACFSGGWPTTATPIAPVQGYLPVSNPQGTSGCGVAVPHSISAHDEGMSALAATYWTNGQSGGAAALHATGTGGSPGSSFCAATSGICAQWAAGSPPVSSDASGHWSIRLTGTINLPYTGGYDFGVLTTQSFNLSIDGYQVLYDGPGAHPNFVPGQPDYFTVTDTQSDGIGFQAGVHHIQVDFHGSATQLNEFDLQWASTYPPPGQSIPVQDIPSSVLDPDYGLQTTSTDADGKTTTYSYTDPAHHIGPQYGLVTATTSDLGGLALTTSATYEDPTQGGYLRKLATTLPAGNQTSYTYYSGTSGPVAAACGVSASAPQGGQVEQQTDPAPGGSGQSLVEQFIYDAVGRQVGERIGAPSDIGSALWDCTTYDARGRIASQSWQLPNQSSRTVTYAYSVGGNPLASSVNDASGTITSYVDLLGRLTDYIDAWNKGTGVTYNQAGQVTGTSGPGGVYQFGYDPNSGLPTTTSVNGPLLATSGYDSAGRLTSVTYGNSTTAAIGYDVYGSQKSVTYGNSSGVITADSVTRSASGRVSTETASQPGGSTATVSYCYDGAGRLAGIAGSAGCSGALTSSYSYAANPGSDNCPTYGGNPGQAANTNRTSVTTPSGTTHYCYNTADQLVATITGGAASTSYTYNEYGEMLNDNGSSYGWDVSGRPIALTSPSGNTTFETYDVVNRLIQSASPSGAVRYSYAGYTNTPDVVMDTSNNILQELVALPGGVSVTMQNSGNVWSYSNLQGDITATANSSGSRTAGPVTYDPWGNLTPGQSAPANTTGPNTLGAYATNGKLTDSATGTIMLGARLFSAVEARFLSVDPVNGGCANTYAYAFGDPLNHPDLTGQDVCTVLDAAQAIELGTALKAGSGSFFKFLLEQMGIVGQILAKLVNQNAIGQQLINAGKAAQGLAKRTGNPAGRGNAVVVVAVGIRKILGFIPVLRVNAIPAWGILDLDGKVGPTGLGGQYLPVIHSLCTGWI